MQLGRFVKIDLRNACTHVIDGSQTQGGALPCPPGNCAGNLDIQEAGNTKDIYLYLIGAFCRKDLHRESQGTHSEDGEQSNIKILYRRTEGCPSEPVQTSSVGLGQQRNINTNSWFTCFLISQADIHSVQRKSKQMAKGSGRKRDTNTSDYKNILGDKTEGLFPLSVTKGHKVFRQVSKRLLLDPNHTWLIFPIQNTYLYP